MDQGPDREQPPALVLPQSYSPVVVPSRLRPTLTAAVLVDFVQHLPYLTFAHVQPQQLQGTAQAAQRSVTCALRWAPLIGGKASSHGGSCPGPGFRVSGPVGPSLEVSYLEGCSQLVSIDGTGTVCIH